MRELAETVGIASLDREVKRVSGVWGRTSGVGTVVSKIRPWAMNFSGCSKRGVGVLSRTSLSK